MNHNAKHYHELLVKAEKALKNTDYSEGLAKILDKEDDYTVSLLADNLFDHRNHLLNHLSKERFHRILMLVNLHTLRNIIAPLTNEQLVNLISQAPVKLRQRIISQVEESKVEEISEAVGEEVRLQLQEQANHPQRTVGRLLHKALVLKDSLNAGKALQQVRKEGYRFASLHQIYIENSNGRYLGFIPLIHLISAPAKQRLGNLVENNQPILYPRTDQAHAAKIFQAYDVSELPVVDNNQIIGRVLIEDIFDVVEQQFGQELQKLGGITGEESLETPPLISSKRRLPWMIFNIMLDLLVVLAVAPFEATIGQVTALAVLMPIVSDMGGNVGIQSLTVSIRALASGRLSWKLPFAELGKELKVGSMNGVVLGVVIGCIGLIGWGNPYLGFVVALALLINTIVASVSGGLLPIIIKKFGKDPALMSGAILTTITDLTGFTIFLGLAKLLMPYLT